MEVLPTEVGIESVDIWFQDEARVGQRGTVTRTMEPTGESFIWQQIELPPITPLVHETTRLTCRCPNCNLVATPQLSEDETLLLGPRLEGLVNLCMARFRQGHRSVREFLSLLVPGLHLSQGLISKIKQRTALAFDHAIKELDQAIEAENNPKHVDATGWRHQGTRWHLVITRTALSIRYSIIKHQNQKAFSQLLGKNVHFIVSDRGLPVEKEGIRLHQYCLAHFLRNVCV